MRFLHTSDWHIGRTFHGQSLLADQEQVLTALAALAEQHDVDAVLVAGDIYDRAVPSADAMQLATRAISALRAATPCVVAIAGNHDSAPRLGVFADVLAHGGLHLRTDAADVATPILLTDAEGPVAIYAIPYLEPEVVRRTFELPGPANHQDVMRAALDRVRSDLATRQPGTRSVVIAHSFVVGGEVSGSERSIAVGGVEAVSSSVFDGIDYVALGHLHGRQSIAEHLRYSGSILPYSFGEADAPKGAWLVDLGPVGTVSAGWLELPVIRPLSEVTGPLEEILSGHADKRDHYLAANLTDPVRPLDPMRRLRECFPYAVTLSWNPPEELAAETSYPKISAEMDDRALIDSFLTDCRGSRADPAEQAVIDAAMTQMRAEHVTA